MASAGGHLQSDAASVRLVGVRDVTRAGPFFDDAGVGSEDFEAWLRLERSSNQSTQDTAVLLQGPRPLRKPVLGLRTPMAPSIDSRQAVVLEWIANQFRDVLAQNDFVIFSDQRRETEISACDAHISLSVAPLDGILAISVAAEIGSRCCWSQSLQVPSGRDLASYRPQILEFAQIAVSAAERTLASGANAGFGAEPRFPLYRAVSQLLTQRPHEINNATKKLYEIEELDSLPTVLAWQAFGKMLMAGERLVEDIGGTQDEAEELLNTALELDMCNPSALAMSAHFQGFYKRNFALAIELSDEALLIAPSAPFAHDVRATLELYRNRLSDAQRHSETASRLARRGPMRHYVGASEVMVATLSGNHELAVQRGQTLLDARPRFLPVMRH
ncbi:MAG: hypothetical protein AAFO68_03250, partial [Pseudomonadota bacterium]